ncbi:hypothetical protein L3Y34_012695 [Caenorhabditis briggsae]|uniref:ZP domain-containing protein n=1 Tax=Caenorhabditis briggsae TaxID=6238 RepID=A0AAE9CW60_CAEBR|nr:hypothetical protein L3Y34_012695 [Caenorhabditis briggsae]
MRLGFVLLIYIVGMSAASVSSIIQYDPIQTDFNITGTIKCHIAPQWCYTVQLLELDSTLNDVIGSVSGCEITNPSQDFLLEDWQLFDGVFDGNFELELLIKHDCGLEITDEKQSLSLSFGHFSTARP